MKEGLEGVVEFLLPELAFAGEQGLSVDGFLALTKQYFKGEKKAAQTQQQGSHSNGDNEVLDPSTSAEASTTSSDAELSFARGAWTWLVSRPNVLVGGNRRWNKLSLDEVLALPEPDGSGAAPSTPAQGDTPAPGSTPALGSAPALGSTPTPGVIPAPGNPQAPEGPSSQTPISAPKQRVTKSKSTLTTRPRIQVTEETVWQAVAGHGVDYKQIPKLEWHLLQGIAPTKHNGILQSDLRRLVGQDKRSVPKRTDFLAAKGYIVKRSIMVRASKTSKLWLAGFAPSTTVESSEASQSMDIKMTKETLIRDLSPVPWHAKWTGADIDVETFAESVIAIVKAWGVMRYSDVRLKMGVYELRWQMRVMARLTRNLVDMGIIKYTAATFNNSRKVWKDCVKFIRDPTEAEWAKILATGKKTSKYTDLSKDRQPKPFALSLSEKTTPQPQETVAKTNDEGAVGASPSKSSSRSLAGWVPEKPLAQTLFDAVDAAGPAGATNPQISAGTVGYNFRRYVGTMLTNMAMCRQPPHLQKFQLNRTLVRVDKTSAFTYTTNQSVQPARSQEQSGHSSVPGALNDDDAHAVEAPAPPKASLYGFAPIQEEKLASPAASLSEISRKLRGRHRQHLPPRPPLIDETPGPDEDGRPPKRRRIVGEGDVEVADVDSQPPLPNEKLPGKPPGAYIGEPGSLNPNRKKNGRPRKSLVVIFKTDKLKDPAFWETDSMLAHNPDETVVNVQYNGIRGKLCLNRRDKTVVFSRKPQLPGKEPLTIQLGDLLEEPVVRPVPGCDDNSLVFVTKESGGNPSWNYVFLFKDDETSQRGVVEILKRVRSIANGEPIGDDQGAEPTEALAITREAGSPGVIETTEQSKPAEPSESLTTGETSMAGQAESTTATPNGKGKGKGRGKRNPPGAGQKPWKCEKCGGTWKNDIGLKYHLTKAQVPCNPDYVATAAVPILSRKRGRRPPTLPSGLEDPANEGEDRDEDEGLAAGRRTTRQRASTKPRKRFDIRLERSGAPAFRGLMVDQSYLSRDTEPVARADTKRLAATSAVSIVEAPRPAAHSGVNESVTPGVKTGQGTAQNNDLLLPENAQMVLNDPTDAPPPHDDIAAHGEAVQSPSSRADDTVRAEAPRREISPTHKDRLVQDDTIVKGKALIHTPSYDEAFVQDDDPTQIDTPMRDIGGLRDEISVRAETALNNANMGGTSPMKEPQTHSLPRSAAQIVSGSEPSDTPLIPSQLAPVKEAKKPTARKTAASVAHGEVQNSGTVSVEAPNEVRAEETPRRRPLPDKPVKRLQDQRDTGPTPFQTANNYVHLSTDSKIRTAQALDIVEYLLQNNGGIFPGDKALFYAMLRIYLKAFSGQTPPSFKNLQVACKRLTTKGKAREIVHAFRHTNGKFVTCTMLLASGMDPNSIVPTVLKKKMQDAYPGVFIPPAFSPSKEELRLLEEFDREPAEIEETPKTEGKFRLRRDNMEVEVMNAPYYQENPQELGGQPDASGHGTPVRGPTGEETSRKRRKRNQTHPVADQPSGRTAKKQKTLGSKLLSLPFARKKDTDAAKDVSDDDTGDVENRSPGSKGASSPEPEISTWEASTMDTTPIANAIKAYGLLPPAKSGPRKRRTVGNLRKLPREVGRAQNPGLDSLPYFFFTNKYDKYWSEHTHATRLQFLDPNTRLDDYHVTSWFEGLGDSALIDDTSSTATDEDVMSSTGEEEPAVVEECSLVPPVIVREHSQGVWPILPTQSFGQSLQMQGWTPSPQFILHEILPASINQLASWNKRKRVKFDGFNDPTFAEFCELVDRCEGWELSKKGMETMTFGTLAPDYIFINASPPVFVSRMQPVAPVWRDENLFTIETFPYELAMTLAEDDDDGQLYKKPKLDPLGKKPRGRPPGKKTSPKKDRAADPQEPREKKRVGRKPKRIRLPALEVEREHTAYPQSAEEYMDIHHGAERSPEWNSEHTQLAAFVCVTTLLGGVAKSVDWGLMMRLFPDMSLSHLRKFFGEMNKDRKSTIIDLTEKFQKAFLEAYEKGELPPLDYDNVLAYDWKALTLWTRGLAGDESTLPPSYADLAQRDMVVSDRAHQPRDWRETFWLPARSLYNRYQDSSSQAFAMSIDPQVQIEGEDDNLRVAMSWVRALCVTAPHPPEVVSDKWETFRGLPRTVISDLIDKSIRILQERLVITKDKNLVVMRLNDRVFKALDKAAQDQKFAEAARFKRRLDRALRKGKGRYRIPYTADDDGMIMALLNLQAHGRITIETDNKCVPLGYEPFNYETRKFDRKYHHFRLFAVPTESYVYNTVQEDNYKDGASDELAVLLDNVKASTPPRVGPQGELPLWVNFFGDVDEIRWRKCLGAVLFILSTRGPMGADAIAEQLKCVVPFEVKMVLDWADRLGLLEQMTPSAPKCVREWWWLAVDAQKKRAEGADARKRKGKGRADAVEVGERGGSASAAAAESRA
ncbi:hypothetical protein BR93DRAFT_977042 [Coniochaeta sp. PMI_546]|nr:hypothetical protein BR93DRAFT_977042 [Coniochaeta sp. PMI_546]